MSKILGKQDIVQADDLVLEQIEVPEWGGSVFVRSISAGERGRIEAGISKYKENKGKDDSFTRTFSLKMAVLSICDEKGARLFDEKDIDLLATRNAAPITRISEAAMRLSGFTKEDMDELEKNSGKAEAGDSSSA